MIEPMQKPFDDTRRGRILDAALSVFSRYGFRKTSMEEVAQAAQISRQALYLHFATKEDLFRATVEGAIERNTRNARAVLAEHELPLETRLIRAFDAWMGEHVGMMASGASDLAEVGGLLAGTIVAGFQAEFVDAVEAALRDSPRMARYAAAGLDARQLAETLKSTAMGLKHSCASREEFIQRIAVAVRALCAD
jgi:AcrR family transcriptional regulator